MMKKCNKIDRGAKPWQAKRKKQKGRWGEGGRVQGEREYRGDSHMEWTGMLVGNFEFNP